MEEIQEFWSNAQTSFRTITAWDVLDIVIVAYLIYRVIWFVRRTNSYNLAKGVIVLLAALFLSDVLRLTMINTLLRKAVELGLIALLILFQPELRRLLERMGRGFTTRTSATSTAMEAAIAQVVLACKEMSDSRTGALMIFERKEKLNSIMATGTIINADVSAELLKNLFFNKAALHDGAVIIRDARIAAAGCVLPLTQNNNLSKELGMRHRAGIGLSEQSDALVIIVSEETGAISVAIEGMLKRHLTEATLDKLLHTELIVDNEDNSRTAQIMRSIRKFFRGEKDENAKKDP